MWFDAFNKKVQCHLHHATMVTHILGQIFPLKILLVETISAVLWILTNLDLTVVAPNG